MTIRPYYPTDHEDCLLIFDSNILRYFAVHERAEFEYWLKGQDEGRLVYDETQTEYYYVTEMNNEVVACGGFCTLKDKPVVHMTWGMVANRWHKHGIGKVLFQYRIDRIEALYPEHEIHMDTTQHTYPFFQKFGFEVTATIKDGYAPGLDRYDMALVR